MQNVGDALHGRVHDRPIRNVPLNDLQPSLGLRKPVVTQRPDAHILIVIGLQHATDEMAADLPVAPVTRMCFMARPFYAGFQVRPALLAVAFFFS